MKGVISKIQERKTKGDKPYWTLTIDGRGYSAFDTKFLEGLAEGDTIDYQWKAKGNFRNLTHLRRLGPGEEPAEEAAGRRVVPMSDEPEGFVPNDVITNMTSLKYATQTISTWDAEPSEKTRRALEIAEVYRAYMRGEDYQARLKALAGERPDREPGLEG